MLKYAEGVGYDVVKIQRVPQRWPTVPDLRRYGEDSWDD
jgi:hypothetical protein